MPLNVAYVVLPGMKSVIVVAMTDVPALSRPQGPHLDVLDPHQPLTAHTRSTSHLTGCISSVHRSLPFPRFLYDCMSSFRSVLILDPRSAFFCRSDALWLMPHSGVGACVHGKRRIMHFLIIVLTPRHVTRCLPYDDLESCSVALGENDDNVRFGET